MAKEKQQTKENIGEQTITNKGLRPNLDPEHVFREKN